MFRHFPLPDVHPRAVLAAHAAVAADAQGHFWPMHDLLFDRQDRLELEHLVAYVVELGLDVERFARDLDAERVRARVRSDVASAEASGARGTPTFFVNGRRHLGLHDAATLGAELAAVRRARGEDGVAEAPDGRRRATGRDGAGDSGR